MLENRAKIVTKKRFPNPFHHISQKKYDYQQKHPLPAHSQNKKCRIKRCRGKRKINPSISPILATPSVVFSDRYSVRQYAKRHKKRKSSPQSEDFIL